MKFLAHLPIYTYVSFIIITLLAYHSVQAKKLSKKLKGSGRSTEIMKWENRKEYCYMGISFLFLVTVFMVLIK
ncbi:hypothetical protein [Mucilaginibacter jinjuensis]|uniref:Uncharacterized protein n=1 Tax=Mucilaginibacter jinjuensis TaxID=1176721 RepID=A0ABY7TBH3_9SPHI|nr:hypothetical protein [Mucilaginibacter jinjuensis]WCT13865.1 hypothetical protein PQO05_07960 [Mucilaginibacter jinjuensis]